MTQLAELRSFLLPVVVIAAVVLLALLVWLLVKAKSKSSFEDAAEEPAPAAPPDAATLPPGESSTTGLGGSFRRGLSALKAYGSGARYQLPWCLLLGASGSRPRDLLADAGLNLPFGQPDSGHLTACQWWFLDQGLVLDLDGELVLGADGRSSDELAWRRFLRLLQRHRPKRPLDAILLTVAARDLVAARDGGVAAAVALEQRAGLLYRKLWHAERQLGLRLPVYLVVTGCEAVGGFAGFCASLPPARLAEIFGWSNPAGVEAAYRPAWIPQAFETLLGRLGELSMEIFAEGRGTRHGDDVLVFPGELASLAGPLRSFLDPLFQASAYGESFLLRGLYFCGRVEAMGPRTAFLSGLIEHKVLRERGLAVPTQRTLLSRNRRVLASQVGVAALAALLTLGTLVGTIRLRASKLTLKPFLEEMQNNRNEMRLAREKLTRPGECVDRAKVESKALSLFEGMSRVDFDHFESLFLPSSWPWFTSFDQDLVSSAVRSYDEVIFKAMSCELIHRGLEVTRPVSSGESQFPAWPDDADAASSALAPAVKLVAVAKEPEFVALEGFVQEVTELESHGRLYNDLPVSQDLNELGQVVDYLFGVELPGGFFEHSRLYRVALGRVDYRHFDPEPLRRPAVEKARVLARGLFDRLTVESDFFQQVEATAQEIDDLETSGLAREDRLDRYQALVTRLDGLQLALSQPTLEWVFQEPFEPGPAFQEVLAQVERSEILGPPVAAEIRGLAEEHWIDLRARLAACEARLVGPVLELANGKPRMQLSPEVLVLKSALSSFLGQSFTQPADLDTFARQLPGGSWLQWDLGRIAQARALADAYERFERDTLRLFPGDLRRQASDVAKAEIASRMDDLLAHAQSFEPAPAPTSPLLAENQLAAAVASFSEAAKPLAGLVEAYGHLDQPVSQSGLRDLVTAQAAALLGRTDRLLDAEALYEPRQGGFTWWRGTAPAAFEAYQVKDPAGLAGYLELEKGRAQVLARQYAQPLLDWLLQYGLSRRADLRNLAERWEGILVALRQDEAKKPGNPVAELEGFITGEMSQANSARCAAAPLAGPEPGQSYFLLRRDELRSRLSSRCLALAAERARDEYLDLAEAFNLHLAGRFPFAEKVGDAFPREVELAEVRNFFRRFDTGQEGFRQVRDQPELAYGASAARVVDFFDSLGAVRRFLAPWLENPVDGALPTLDLAAEFRVNQVGVEGAQSEQAAGNPEVELGAERVIDWRLAVGDKQVDHRSAERRLTWQAGAPVELTLRWAEDSPRLPETALAAPDGLTVVYRYEGLWSLLALVADHKSRDPRRETLRFEVPTRARPEAVPKPPPEGPSRLYVRLGLTAPPREGKPGEVLTVPRFPTVAPELPGLRSAAAMSPKGVS